MLIEQAIYGEDRSGHGLRLASSKNEVIEALASRLDLPDTAPPGVEWSPFLSGFPFGKYYIIARTFIDPHATRSGMVFTHALIAPLNEIIEWPNIDPLVSMLLEEPVYPAELNSLDLQSIDRTSATSDDLQIVAEELIAHGEGPVVRIGVDGFDNLVMSLWPNLWPAIRATFAFRLSFSPKDIVETPPPILVSVPSTLSSRWQQSRIVGSRTRATTLASSLLCGNEQAKALIYLARDLNCDLRVLSDILLMERIYQVLSNPDADLRACISALRLVVQCSRNVVDGKACKQELVCRLLTKLPSASAEDICLLRNIETNALQEGKKVWSAVSSWVSNNAFQQQDDSAILSVLEYAKTDQALDAWRKAILAGFNKAETDQAAKAIWRWSIIAPKLISILINDFPRGIAERLERFSPHSRCDDIDAGVAMMELALSHQWLNLYAIVASVYHPPLDALRLMLNLTESDDIEGIKTALRFAGPQEIINFAIKLIDHRVMRFAAELAASDPTLLKELSFEDNACQQLWGLSMSINMLAWKGPRDPSMACLTAILSASAPPQLVETLSMTPLADLSRHSELQCVWPLLSGRAKEKFLVKTAEGWITKSLKNIADTQAPDSELETVIIQEDVIGQFLRDIEIPPKKTLQLLEVLPTIDESLVMRWVSFLISNSVLLNQSEEMLFSKLIKVRGWRRTVELLAEGYRNHSRADFEDVVKENSSLLNFFTAIAFPFIGISTSAIWSEFEKIATELYPHGPTSNGLWERSGGDVSELEQAGPGKIAWENVIKGFKKGKWHKPSMKSLLNAMRDDFPKNRKLTHLCSDKVLDKIC